MSQTIKSKVVGPGEYVDLPELGFYKVPARIDTGAYYSSIWASDIILSDDGASFVMFGPSSPFYTGERISVPANKVKTVKVVNSFGQAEQRLKLKLLIVVQNRRIRGTFTLADRSQKLYPILIGKRLITNKFLVDTSLDQPFSEKDKAKLRRDLPLSGQQFKKEQS